MGAVRNWKYMVPALAVAVAGMDASAEGVAAEAVRPVNSSYMIEAGSSHLADTYLSPLKYTGWNAAFQ